MSSFKWPVSGGGSGIAIYASVGDLPATSADGTVASVADTNTIYQYDAGTPGWIMVGQQIVGTANQVNATFAANKLTLSTPQNIDSTASPSFYGVNVNATQANPAYAEGKMFYDSGEKTLAY